MVVCCLPPFTYLLTYAGTPTKATKQGIKRVKYQQKHKAARHEAHNQSG